MQVTETNADGLKHEFKIVVPAEKIEEKVEGRLKELSSQVRLPGFRPGKVPMGLLRQRYGQSVMGEVLEGAVQDGVRNTLEERKLTPAMQPKIEVTSFEEGKDLEFTMEFEALPEIAALDLGSIELEKPKVAVPEDEVDEALGRIAESRKQHERSDSKRKAKKGDVLEIDFVGRIGGEEFAGGKGEGYDLELGSGAFIPGFEDQLIGAKPGETHTVEVTFPEEYHAADLAGKKAEFEVAVKAHKEAKVPEIDEDFAKSVGMESVDDLKQAVREQIQSDYDRLARNKMKRELLDKLAEKADFDVPQGMVEQEFNAIWAQIEEAKKNDQLDDEDKDKSDDELREEYRKIAERRVRLGLLLADIGRKNEIQVTQEDLNRAIMQEAQRFPGQEQMVFQYFQQNQQALEQLRAPIYEDKVVDFILEMANTTEKEVTVQELTGEDAEPAEGEDKPKKKASPAKKPAGTKKAAASKAKKADAEPAKDETAE